MMTAPPPPFTMRLPAGPAALPVLLDALEAWLAATGLSDEARLDLALAVDEAVANILEHGYRGGPGEVEVVAAADDAGVTITVADAGPPFDPLGVPPPALDGDLESRPAGGLGIHLIRSLTDSVEYRREGDRNVLVMRRALPP